MSLSIGIIGLPNVGKSTLFKALTRNPVDISNYPFTTIEPNEGIVEVQDENLKKLTEMIRPQKSTPAVIKFIDIAGLVKKAHKGEGLGNQFLAQIREVDVILHVVRTFKNENVAHTEGHVTPKEDVDIVNTELVLKDIETLEKYAGTLTKDAKSGNKEIIKELEITQKIKTGLDNEKWANTQEGYHALNHLQLLTAKNVIYVLNGESDNSLDLSPHILMDVKLEEERSEMDQEEIKELGMTSNIGNLIRLSYETLNFITFYTVKGGAEVRAWPIQKGITAPAAAAVVHTDFGEKFIRAEVISIETLLEDSSWASAREKGHIRTEGKEYIVRDRDVIEFKI